jgi:hypothetical protein
MSTKHDAQKLDKVRRYAIWMLKQADEKCGTDDDYGTVVPQLVSEVISILEFKCPVCWYDEPHHESECPEK